MQWYWILNWISKILNYILTKVVLNLLIDFILINKKGSFVKKYAIECQTNKGHLAPMDKHRDCILGRYIAFRTDYHFLEYSSYEIFGDSNISSIDELIDDLDF